MNSDQQKDQPKKKLTRADLTPEDWAKINAKVDRIMKLRKEGINPKKPRLGATVWATIAQGCSGLARPR
ncbi:MAG TPA: hypothetical protein PKJ25_07115 [Smithellaceae bacterium]|nr:hypothetical protein [Smithellaceae bacterium]